MKLAIVIGLAPRKLGSFESWILTLCRIARERGHHVDLYGRMPIHPQVKTDLDRLGVGWGVVGNLEKSTSAGIKTLSRYNAIHLNLFHPRSRIAQLSYLAWPAKVLFVDHTSGERAQPTGFRAHLRRVADMFSMLRVHGVAGVSNYVTERAKSRYRFGPHSINTIYNGIDTEKFAPAERRSAREELTIATVCWLRKDKGVDVLLRAFAQTDYERMRLRVIGDGPELDSLLALARDLGVSSRVTFEGLRDDVDVVMKESDIFVHPAVWKEAFGLTIAEAMACEKCVIATRTGGIPEIIEHEKSGLLVTPGSAKEIADALVRLASAEALREQLGKNARRRVLEKFEISRSAREHVEWFESAVGAYSMPVSSSSAV